MEGQPSDDHKLYLYIYIYIYLFIKKKNIQLELYHGGTNMTPRLILKKTSYYHKSTTVQL